MGAYTPVGTMKIARVCASLIFLGPLLVGCLGAGNGHIAESIDAQQVAELVNIGMVGQLNGWQMVAGSGPQLYLRSVRAGENSHEVFLTVLKECGEHRTKPPGSSVRQLFVGFPKLDLELRQSVPGLTNAYRARARVDVDDTQFLVDAVTSVQQSCTYDVVTWTSAALEESAEALDRVRKELFASRQIGDAAAEATPLAGLNAASASELSIRPSSLRSVEMIGTPSTVGPGENGGDPN